MSNVFDVVVIGAGPGGAAASLRSSEMGFKTILLEKETFPREKVCAGMLFRACRIVIEEEFGRIPREVLCDPPEKKGVIIHVPDIGEVVLEHWMTIGWRKDIDSWMVNRAIDKGVEFHDNTPVRSVGLSDDSCVLKVGGSMHGQEINSRFVVGSDGAFSTIRNNLYPEFRPKYISSYQEYYEGEVDLDDNYWHVFHSTDPTLSRFTVNSRDRILFTAGVKQEVLGYWKRLLAEKHRFRGRVTRTATCLGAIVGVDRFSGGFRLARSNALLVGDAGGLNMPITGEGISTAAKSGVVAALCIRNAVDKGGRVAELYKERMKAFFSELRKQFELGEEVKEELSGRSQVALDKLLGAYASAFTTADKLVSSGEL